jgi:hypothetical protein
MYYRTKKGGDVHGVLNDFDLSMLAIDGRIYSFERTGTWAFMAMALLKAKRGEVKHIYGAFRYLAKLPHSH